MKCKTVKRFFDIEAKCQREVGDTFECSAERFKAINSTAHGTLAEEVKATRSRKKASEEE